MTFGFPAPQNIKMIYITIFVTLSLPDNGYYRNESFTRY